MDKKLFLRLLTYALKFKKQLIIALFLVIFYSFLSSLLPVYFGHIIDVYLPSANQNPMLMTFALFVIGYVVYTFIVAIFSVIANTYAQNYAHKIATKFREDLFSHVQDLPVSFFDKTPVGSIVSRLTSDTKFIKFLYQAVIKDILFSLISIVNVVVILFFVDKNTSVLAFILLIIIVLMSIDFVVKQAKYQYQSRKINAKINVQFNENIIGSTTIQVYNQQKYFDKNFEEVNLSSRKISRKFVILESYNGHTFSRFIDSFVISTILIYAMYQSFIMKQAITPGLIFVFINILSKVIWSLQSATYTLATLGRAIQSAKHAFELLKENKVPVGNKKIDLKGEIIFENVDFAYQRETVLKQFNLKVNAGETIGIVGHTGSGKTTLMNILMKFYPIKAGNVFIDNEKIETLDDEYYCNQISIVLQTPLILNATLKENITMGYKYSDDAVFEAIKQVGIEYIVNRDKKGIYQMLNADTGLSTGEKQLIAFARALIKNPKILILDEASANIDSESELLIQNGITTLLKQRTTFIIAHRLSTLKQADKIIVLEKGELKEIGTHEQLVMQNGIYKRFLDKQT